jgi:hypothetical protein
MNRINLYYAVKILKITNLIYLNEVYLAETSH